MKTMAEWAKEIHENAVAHGWWEEDRTISEICALIHSELSEALEEARAALPKMEYHKYPDICMAMISAADMVYLLEGWEESAGAAWEAAYARRMGKTIFEEQS